MNLALASIFWPFLGALVMMPLYPLFRRRLGWAALVVALGALALVLITPAGLSTTLPWVPQLGINLTVAVDGWGRMLAYLITGIGSLVLLYSILYLDQREDLGKFYTYLLLFMGAMLGVVLAGNLVTLYIFWELTSVSSFMLIGFWWTGLGGNYGSLKSLLLTVGGGFCMLGGILLLGQIGGTYEWGALLAQKEAILAHPSAGIALVLILLGAFAKSAQVPFHIWLPDAMAAPTPVSAYLHSATMVKAGLFLVGRIWPLFASHPYWLPIVSTVGLLTMALGAFLALQKTDLKAILALSTVSQLGLIMSLFGLGTSEGLGAGVFHLLNHAIFKGLLFMVVGIIDHETGTRDIRRLSGLRKAMPVSAVLMAIGAASMAGVPLFNGFLSKEAFLDAVYHSPLGLTGAVVATLASMLTTLYCLVLVLKVFFGEPAEDLPKHPHEAPKLMLAAPAVLALLAIAIGVLPELVYGILADATGALVVSYSLEVGGFHGVSPALIMSATALGGGALLYTQRGALVDLFRRWTPQNLHLNRLYNALWWEEQYVERGAKRLNGLQMTGLLRDYLITTFVVIIAAVLGTVWYKGIRFGELDLAPIALHEAILIGLMLAGAILTVRARTRLTAMVAITLIGMPTALWYALMRAPDLALTQLVVEVVSTVLFLVVFAHLPQLKVYPRTPRIQDVNVVVATGVGLVAGLITLFANGHRIFKPEIAQFYLDNAYKGGGAHNVVNVTIADFRGFDTMFEITVLTIAGLAIFTLIRLRQPKGGERK
ncbi:MAG TPA: hydrogen gas-evolving membrane-bound hydrogenase subunit E [Symbiobacteriaceae bacterium]|nr:hydrogen gas-evolving membrane-bound hydrogenase subunit E [Symbiobacteriaceae bacterium]